MTTKARDVTRHGEIEYEVVECDACGSEVPKQQAKPYAIGERAKWRSGDSRARPKLTMHGEVAGGYVCEVCTDDPTGVPWGHSAPEIRRTYALVGACIGAVFMFVLMVVTSGVLP